jgi:hypothetical protein
MVVDAAPRVGERTEFRDRFEKVRVQHLRELAAIETLDVRGLIGGFPGWM